MNPVRGASTDANGRYSLTLPCDSVIVLSVRYTGYETIDTIVSLRAGANTVMDFALRRGSRLLGPVTVTNWRVRNKAFVSINLERIENNVGPQGGVEALLKTLPDVSSNNEMSSQYSVRGGSFDENLVYVNGVEIYRPQLIRSGQQEGTSIINPDMVDNVIFSPGGFDASYGDRMASVLDITYGDHGTSMSGDTLPRYGKWKASASFLGGSLSTYGAVGDKFTYSVGFRHHANRYLFRSLDTKGNYTTRYTDLQALLSYRVSDALRLSLLSVVSRNVYGLIPESQTTTFGGFEEVMQFDVFYEGEESDSYNTALAALTMEYRPNDDFKLLWTNSVQTIREHEMYDILSQYWLYELNVGNYDDDGNTERFDRGVGSFQEHARNHLSTNIFATELQGTHYAVLGNWRWGVKAQYEQLRDKVREWKWVDSAGYAMPTVIPTPGNDSNSPQTPILQRFCNSDHALSTSRLSGFVQRDVELYNDRGDQFTIVGGVRLHGYDINFSNDTMTDVATPVHNRRLFVSPRLGATYKPKIKKDIMFRLTAGIYNQAPFYREYRYDNGDLNRTILPQRSYQAMGNMDWNFRVGESPFKFTTDIYYKYITDLIPYRIDNLRIRYDATNNAVGYATGISFRLSGEVVKGLESWASLTLMKTQEDIEGDEFGWLPRPTDQRISFKLFFQDYVPTIPFWRMSLNFIYGTGMPCTHPSRKDFGVDHTIPAYFRVDWGNTLQLSRLRAIRDSWIMRHVDDVLLSLEVFNLFDYKNVVSYIWVADYSNTYYPVPNYLTARQINFKVTVEF